MPKNQYTPALHLHRKCHRHRRRWSKSRPFRRSRKAPRHTYKSCPPRWLCCRSCRPWHRCIQKFHPCHTPHPHPHPRRNRLRTRQVHPIGSRHNHSHRQVCLNTRTRKSLLDHRRCRRHRIRLRSHRHRHRCHRHRNLPRNCRHIRPKRRAHFLRSRNRLMGCQNTHIHTLLPGHCRCHTHRVRPRSCPHHHRCHRHRHPPSNRRHIHPTRPAGCHCNHNPLLECLNIHRRKPLPDRCTHHRHQAFPRSRPHRHRCHRHPRQLCSSRRIRPRHRTGCRCSRSHWQGCQNIRTRRCRLDRCKCHTRQKPRRNRRRRHKCRRHPRPHRSHRHTLPKRRVGFHHNRNLRRGCRNSHTRRFRLDRCTHCTHRVRRHIRRHCRKCHPSLRLLRTIHHKHQGRRFGFRRSHNLLLGCLYSHKCTPNLDHCRFRTRHRYLHSRRHHHKRHPHPRPHRMYLRIRQGRQVDCHCSRSLPAGCLSNRIRTPRQVHCTRHMHPGHPHKGRRRHRGHLHRHLLGSPLRKRQGHRADFLHNRSLLLQCLHIHSHKPDRGRCKRHRHRRCQRTHRHHRKCRRHQRLHRNLHRTRSRHRVGCRRSRNRLLGCWCIHKCTQHPDHCISCKRRFRRHIRPRCRKCHRHLHPRGSRLRMRQAHRAGCHRNRNRQRGCRCHHRHHIRPCTDRHRCPGWLRHHNCTLQHRCSLPPRPHKIRRRTLHSHRSSRQCRRCNRRHCCSGCRHPRLGPSTSPPQMWTREIGLEFGLEAWH